MSGLSHRELLTYSFVSQGVYGITDRLSGILPFFLPIIKTMQGEIFDRKHFINEVNVAYAWEINEDICFELIRRFCKAGWLKEIKLNASTSQYAVLTISDYDKDEASLQSASKSLEKIGSAFKDLIAQISPIQGCAFEPEYLQDLILKWLADRHAFGKSAILALTKPRLPVVSNKLNNPEIVQSASTKHNSDENYLCARFVEYLSQTDDDLFNQLVAIAAVALVIEVALDLKSPAQPKIDLKKAEFFFDGPLAMDLLGLSGKERHANSSYLFEKLREFGAQGSIFSHSCDEIRDNLRALIKAHRGDRYGPTAEAIKKGEVVEDYARSVLADVESNVERVGLSVKRIDLKSYPNAHTYFDGSLLEELGYRIPWEPPASIRDAQSVAFVMRSRAGRSSPDFSLNRSTLVSGNNLLVDITRRFCLEHDLIAGNQIGPALFRTQLSAMLWLALGSSEKKEITRRDLIARCADVVRLSPSVVERARSTLLKMKDTAKSAQFEALLTTPRASQMIMDLTLGVPDRIGTNDINHILESIKKTAADEIDKEYRQKYLDQRSKFRERLNKADQLNQHALSKIKSDLEKGQEHVASLTDKVVEFERKDRETCKYILKQVEQRIDNRVRLLKNATSIVVIAGAIFLGLREYMEDSASTNLVALCVILGVFTALIGAVQISDHWLRPLSSAVFTRKIKLLKIQLENLGRPDLGDHFVQNYNTRTITLKTGSADATNQPDILEAYPLAEDQNTSNNASGASLLRF